MSRARRAGVRALAAPLCALLALHMCSTPAGSSANSAGNGDSALLEYAQERARLCGAANCAGSVIVGFANMGYSRFALNWVLSMRHAGIDNFVLVALDSRVHAYFARLGVPSFHATAFGDFAEGSQHHKSSKFRDIMHIRLHSVLLLLRGGLNVWLTDVDAVFNSDPFPFVTAAALGTHSSALAYDTPFLPKGKNSPLMVMAGFFYLRRCAASPGDAGAVYPANCELLDDTLAHMQAHPEKHDQFAFNAVLSEKEKQVCPSPLPRTFSVALDVR
jgi:hypothetical protein